MSGNDDKFGTAAVAGFFDAGGDIDIAVGAPGYGTPQPRGTVYVLYGPFVNGVPSSWGYLTPPGSLDPQIGHNLGTTVISTNSYLPDLSSLESPRFVAGAPGWGAGSLVRAGRAFEYQDNAGSIVNIEYDIGSISSDQVGSSLTSCDFNDDSYSDFVIGGFRGVTAAPHGKVYIYFGGPGSDTIADVEIISSGTTQTFGSVLGGMADVSNDSFGDLIIGDADAGIAYLVYGRDIGQAALGAPLVVNVSVPDIISHRSIVGPTLVGAIGGIDFTGDLVGDLILADGSTGDILIYEGPISDAGALTSIATIEGSGGTFGKEMALNGDINGDGVNDLLISDTAYNITGTSRSEGRVTAIMGGDWLQAEGTIDCSPGVVSTQYVWHIFGPDVTSTFSWEFGKSIGYMGDIVGNDNRDEIFVGVPREIHADGTKSGAIHGFNFSDSNTIQVAASAEDPISSGSECSGARLFSVEIIHTGGAPIEAVLDATNLDAGSSIPLVDSGNNIFTATIPGSIIPGSKTVQVFVSTQFVSGTNGEFALQDVAVEVIYGNSAILVADYPLSTEVSDPLVAVRANHCSGIGINTLYLQGPNSVDGTPFGWPSSTTLQDLNTNGDEIAGDGIYSFQSPFLDVSEIAPGFYEFDVIGIDANSTAFFDRVTLQVISPNVVSYVNRSLDTKLDYPGQPYSAVTIDFDQVGPKDMFMSYLGAEPGRLYSSESSTIRDVPEFIREGDLATSGAIPIRLLGLTVGDFDNDGGQDLFAASQTNARIYRAEGGAPGDRTLADVSVAMVSSGDLDNSVTGSWADYDYDGQLDLFVGRADCGTFEPGEGQISMPDILLKNDELGSGTFINVSVTSGIQLAGSTNCVTAAWGDVDSDGWLDLFIGEANALGGGSPGTTLSRLYINNRDGTFIDEGTSWFGNDVYQINGASLTDLDNDGDIDLVTSSSVNDNKIYLNSGAGSFQAGQVVTVGNASAGVVVYDHDFDGIKDLLYLPSAAGDQPSLLKSSISSGMTFTDVTVNSGLNWLGKVGGCIVSDFNKDGDYDLLMGKTSSGNSFFFTAASEDPTVDKASTNWIGYNLSSAINSVNNFMGIGAVVTVTQNGDTYSRQLDGGSGRGGQDDNTLIIGLPSSSAVTASVEWANSRVQSLPLPHRELNKIHDVSDDTSTDAAIQYTSGTYEIEPSTGLSKWHFTWVTAVKTFPDDDRVVFDNAIPAVGIVAGTVISRNTGGVTHIVSPEPGDKIKHELIWINQVCAVGTVVSFRVESESILGAISTSLERSFTITVCGKKINIQN